MALGVERFGQGIFNVLVGEEVGGLHPAQPVIALSQNLRIVFAQHQHAWLVGDDGQGHGLGQREVVGWLLEVEQRGRFHTLDVAAVGHQVEV